MDEMKLYESLRYLFFRLNNNCFQKLCFGRAFFVRSVFDICCKKLLTD